jgi:hypothetical protein
VHRDEVALPQQLVQADEPDADLRGAAGLDVRVVGDQRHAEGRQPLGDEHADAPEPHDAHGLLEQLDTGVLAALPLPAAQRRVGGRDVPAAGQQQPIASSAALTMLEVGAFTTMTPACVGGRNVDVVQADTGPGDDLELLRRGTASASIFVALRIRHRVDVAERSQQLERSAPLQDRISKSGPRASTVAGESSSAMSTTGLATGILVRWTTEQA